MPVPLNQVLLKKEDLEDPGLTLLNQILQNLTQQSNALAGHAGPISLANDLDLGGKRIKNLGPAQTETDAISKAVGTENFGPAAIQPQLDALGSNILQSTRRVNDRIQRENYSSFLNDMVSTAPTTNTSLISAQSPSGGSVQVTITAGFHQRVDGSQVAYAGRTDILSLPFPAQPIATLSRVSGVVTVTFVFSPSYTVDEVITIVGAGDSSFNGTFTISKVLSANQYQYFQQAANASTTGGSASIGGVYYYYLRKHTNMLGLAGPFSNDNWQNRLGTTQIPVSIDGQTIIAVIVINNNGVDALNSAAGATPTVTGPNVHIFGRL